MEWYIGVLKKYAVFSGRARRKEYWMFFLFNSIISFVIGFVFGLIGGLTGNEGITFIAYIYSLAVLIPGLAVAIRRLHDIGKSGLWLLIALIPFIGAIWLLILMCKEGDPSPNIYGDSPK